MNKLKHSFWISKCCGAEATMVISPNFIGDDPESMEVGTCHFVCSKCGKECNAEEKNGKLIVKKNQRYICYYKPKEIK